jgi:aspartate/glutamate racemase
MAQISMEYQGDMDVFLEKVNDKSASIEDINRAGESHEKHVEYTKKLIGNNKGMLKDFWKDKMKENGIIDEVIPEQLKQQGFKAFMAIFHREGTFQLEHMNKQDLKNVLTKILDESKKS